MRPTNPMMAVFFVKGDTVGSRRHGPIFNPESKPMSFLKHFKSSSEEFNVKRSNVKKPW